jgi:hypothetical protein
MEKADGRGWQALKPRILKRPLVLRDHYLLSRERRGGVVSYFASVVKRPALGPNG